MSVFCLEDIKTGEVFERVGSHLDILRKKDENGNYVLDNGQVVRVRIDLQLGSVRQVTGTWPLECYQMGVNPSEVREFIEDARRRGVPTEFNPRTGDAIFTSRAHKKKYCRTYGYHCSNGGFGDP